ncbi:MAG: 50S ribosomal protein L6 [Proteobacteria bacterium]|nr:50S ribosomal protein L6 [Pseudomonadota bacterium]
MSRIGRKPITLPDGVEVKKDGNTVTVKGPKGTLSKIFDPRIKVEIKDKVIKVSTETNSNDVKALFGLTRALINNMVIGVSKGFERKLVIEGVGYRAVMQGTDLQLNVGYSHTVLINKPEGINFVVEGAKAEIVKVQGIDKEAVGFYADKIRGIRPPEPYKGKGIRYDGEYIRRKAGKTGA